MIQIAIAGALGRMGRCVMDVVARDDRFEIAAALTRPDDPKIGTTIRSGETEAIVADRLGVPCELLIDFSSPAGTVVWAKVCERLQIPLISGVTGHDDDQTARLREAARVIPIVMAANFSIGMNAMLAAVRDVALKLGRGFDIEIIETHHRNKVDAPSGTALALVQSVTGTTEADEPHPIVHGREGNVGRRPEGQVCVHTVRMGDIVGGHKVCFGGAGETLMIEHVVQSRDTFVAGALRAAEWAVEKPPGLYSMEDVLGEA